MESKIDLSIVIPCYNEAGSLANLFKTCREALSDESGIEFVFVNNGSSDTSLEKFQEYVAQPENKFARIVNIPVNKGYGHGILEGLRKSGGECLAWTHADLQTDPADVIKAYRKYQKILVEGETLVKGRRKRRNWVDGFFTTGMSLLSSILLNSTLSDVNAQPKIFHRSFLSRLDRAPSDFSLDLYLLYVARKAGFQLIEVPVYFAKREFGTAKGGGTLKGKIKLVKRTFAFIMKLRREIQTNQR